MIEYIQKFYPHFWRCFSGIFFIAFYEGYGKINKFLNSKYNFVSRFNKLQNTAIELGSKDTFLRTWNSLLNYN